MTQVNGYYTQAYRAVRHWRLSVDRLPFFVCGVVIPWYRYNLCTAQREWSAVVGYWKVTVYPELTYEAVEQ